MKSFYTTILFIVSSTILFGQATNVKRIEFNAKEEESTPEYITFGKYGVLQRSVDLAKLKADKKNYTTTYTLFSTDLKRTDSIDFKTPENYSNETRTNNESYFYELSWDKKKNYILHCLDIATFQSQTFTGKLLPKMYVNSFKSLPGYVFIEGEANKIPVIIIKNIVSGEEYFSKFIPTSKRDFELLNFEINKKSQEAYAFIKDKIADKIIITMYIYSKGKEIGKYTLPYNEGKFLQNVTASKLNDGSYILTGTYNNSKKGAASVGLFISKITNGKTMFTQYVNYLEINNFTSHLSTKGQDKIEKKKDKKQQKGEELELNYLMAPHSIIEYNNTYLLVGESYYPTYRRECYTTTTSSGTTQTCYYVFDGYYYTHYFLYSFDQNGNPLWSNSKEMDINFKPMSPILFLDLQFNEGNLSALYGSGNTFQYSVFNNKGEETKTSIQKIETEKESDNVKISSMTTKHWFDNNYIAYGFQKIKNSEEKDKRKVFYINKIQVIP